MRLTLLDFGGIRSTVRGERQLVPVPGALIETDSGELVLVDTGMPERCIGQTEPFPDSPVAMTPVMERRNWAPEQLALLGLRPADVAYVVATHFDWDHDGANECFPHATFFVQREHLRDARRSSRYWRDLWDIPGLRYEELDGDAEPVPGVRLIETSGHVPGHQSVVVDLPRSGTIVLAVDAIKSAEQLRTAHWEGPDVERSRASGERLASLLGERGEGLLVFGHDAEQWPALRRAPVWYD